MSIEELRQKISQSTVFACITPKEPDAQQAAQIGLAILMDKPIVLINFDGRTVPEKLRLVADKIFEADSSDPDSLKELAPEIAKFADQITQ